jgi:hypothetical protein
MYGYSGESVKPRRQGHSLAVARHTRELSLHSSVAYQKVCNPNRMENGKVLRVYSSASNPSIPGLVY